MTNQAQALSSEPSPFIDLRALWRSAEGLPHSARLRALFRHAEVDLHDEEGYWVRAPRVAIVGVGGLPIQLIDGRPHLLERPVSRASLGAELKEMMGYSGFMSYLNPRDKSPEALTDTMFKLGHTSTAHTCHVNVLALGLSVAAEVELCCQRDLVHLSRLTVARTAAQDDPTWVVLDPEHLPTLQTLRAHLQETRDSLGGSREALNNIFPSSRATMTMISGSLRSYQKLTSARDDSGKEDEYRQLLHAIHTLLTPLAPELFS